MGFSTGGNESSSNSDPWAPAQSQLEDILKLSESMYNNGGMDFTKDDSYAKEGIDYYKNIANGGMDIGSDDLTKYAGGLWDEDLEASMRDSAVDSTNQAFAQQDTTAQATGGAGSSRTGLAQASAASTIQNDLNTQFGQMRQDNLDTANAALSANRSTAIGAGGSAIDLGSDLSDIDYQNQQSQLAALQAYASLIGGIGGMGGSTDSSGSNYGFTFG